MKKLVIPVIIVVFGVCAYFGFKAASKILSGGQVPIDQTAVLNVNPPVLQKNFVFIHVDDLSLEEPQLISIWAGFVNETAPPQFMFLPLFPVYNIEVHDRVIKSFGLTLDKKKVKNRFLNQLKSSFNFKIDGYILSDDTGVSYSNKLLANVDTPLSSIQATTDADKHVLLLKEQTSWQQFCNFVNQGTANTYFSAINWDMIMPNHFATDLDFESITLLTNQIVHATGKLQCEVLSKE